MTQRLSGVVVAVACAMVMTTAAHARTSAIEYGHADDNRPRITSEAIAVQHRASHRVARKHKTQRPRIAQQRKVKPAVQSVSTQPGDTSLVAKARAYIGMTAAQIGVRRDLWCSAFMRFVAGTPRGVDDRAISWSGQKHIPGQVGAIVIVRSRRMHVGVVSGFDAKGNPRVISGNHGNRVAESIYPRSSVVAYVSPSS